MTESTAAVSVLRASGRRWHRRPLVLLVRRSWQLGRTRIGVALVLLLLGSAVIGPLFAPHAPAEFVGAPYAHASSTSLLGTDNLGRDILSRFLWGGRSILGLSAAATAIGLALGVTIGLTAAYTRSLLDDVLMRLMDVILAFPSIVLALVAVATVGPKLWLIVLVVGLTTMPRVARVTRGASLEIVERDFVQAAEAMGESRLKILAGELLPNITGPLLVEASLRLTFSIGLIAGLSFLGFGLQPPAADWGLMINENRQALTVQPWGVLMPVIAIALLTIGTSMIGDGVARASAGIDRGAASE
ncbi:MAG TPA: ABC transporter permease [Gaiellaceae bacterium]